MNESVFEVIDSSNDEMYFTQGIFLTLEDAKNSLLDLANDKESAITEYGGDGDCEEITIEERKLGWSGRGKEVFKMTREYQYSEEADDSFWITTFNSDDAKKL